MPLSTPLTALLGLQLFHVLFLFAHDWLPLGRLNDVAAQRATDPLPRRLLVTLLNALPFLVLLVATVHDLPSGHLGRGLLRWLWLGYALLFLGELRAWWLPYLLRPDPARALRYTALFGNTHAFLPARNGLQPNTLHVLLHTATLLTLLCLAALSAPLP